MIKHTFLKMMLESDFPFVFVFFSSSKINEQRETKMTGIALSRFRGKLYFPSLGGRQQTCFERHEF